MYILRIQISDSSKQVSKSIKPSDIISNSPKTNHWVVKTSQDNKVLNRYLLVTHLLNTLKYFYIKNGSVPMSTLPF